MAGMPTLLVLLKYPSPGAVKTRLAASIGPQRAAALYRGWIGLVLDRLQLLRMDSRVVGYFDGAPQEAFAPWRTLADEWWRQPPGDLGERLRAGFATAHARGAPVAAVGTDCLELDPPLVQRAFDLLRQTDAVFGPAADGGYYLVGTARDLPGFFDGIPWSSPATLTAHRALCAARGWSVGLLPVRPDIDTWEDWLRHGRVGRGQR
jgi:rSAM/selenodomain-associated transferase 1